MPPHGGSGRHQTPGMEGCSGVSVPAGGHLLGLHEEVSAGLALRWEGGEVSDPCSKAILIGMALSQWWPL